MKKLTYKQKYLLLRNGLVFAGLALLWGEIGVIALNVCGIIA